MHWMLRGLAGALVASMAVGLAACGGRERSKSGEISVAVSAFPDSLDPALAYTGEALQSLWVVYTPLLTYAHAEGAAGARIVPGLARAQPRISADGKTYRLMLRKGLEYSDGRPVKASDFEHSVKRILNLESVGTSYFERIAGAGAYLRSGRARGDISGIETDDRTGAITISLDEPYGPFSNVLAMPFGALVPSDTPFQNQTKRPPPGVGAFKLAKVRVNRGYDLVKAPGFDVADMPKAQLDTISIEVVKNRGRQTQSVTRNDLDYMTDPPASDQIRAVRDRFEGKRYREFVTNSTYFFFLNHRLAPFNMKAVRQAVNYALDERALVRVFGGLLEPGCNFLPPGLAGYKKIEPCPYGDPDAPPELARARQLVEQAGAEGEEVTVYGTDEPEARSAAEYFADALSQIGLKARPRVISSEVYFATIGNAKTRAQAGFANFFEDFPRATNFFSLVDGASIAAANSTNFGNVDDPQINATLARADRNPSAEAVAKDYAAVDRRLLDEAHLVPYGNRKLSVFFSDRIDFDDCTAWHPVYNLDYTSLCLK